MPDGATLPEGPEWAYEIKLDGYRAQVLCDGEKTQLLSRNGKDLACRFPALVEALSTAAPHGSILDGELVALDTWGRPHFSLIQNSATSDATSVFCAFDLLQLEGIDLTRKPLSGGKWNRLHNASLHQVAADTHRKAATRWESRDPICKRLPILVPRSVERRCVPDLRRGTRYASTRLASIRVKGKALRIDEAPCSAARLWCALSLDQRDDGPAYCRSCVRSPVTQGL